MRAGQSGRGQSGGKFDRSDWAAPILPVPKPDGSLRNCGDNKVTINPVLEMDQYPLPKPVDQMASGYTTECSKRSTGEGFKGGQIHMPFTK